MGYRLLSFLLLAGGTASRPPDYRWEEPLPESFHQVLAGDMIALSYGYTTRNDITEEVKVELSHHVLSNNYENVLIAANINPLNLQPEVIYDRIPGRVIINATDHRFTFILPNVTPNESGRYWADVTFSTGTNLDHMTDVTIYQRPSFKQAPSKEVVINENGTATFEWSQTKSDAIPEVETVRVTYQNYTLVNQRKLSDTGQWMITYPDVYGTFKNRISYAASPNLDHISITVCGLRIGDSGLYTLEIIYTPRMVTLTNATTLVVTPALAAGQQSEQIVYNIDKSLLPPMCGASTATFERVTQETSQGNWKTLSTIATCGTVQSGFACDFDDHRWTGRKGIRFGSFRVNVTDTSQGGYYRLNIECGERSGAYMKELYVFGDPSTPVIMQSKDTELTCQSSSTSEPVSSRRPLLYVWSVCPASTEITAPPDCFRKGPTEDNMLTLTKNDQEAYISVKCSVQEPGSNLSSNSSRIIKVYEPTCDNELLRSPGVQRATSGETIHFWWETKKDISKYVRMSCKRNDSEIITFTPSTMSAWTDLPRVYAKTTPRGFGFTMVNVSAADTRHLYTMDMLGRDNRSCESTFVFFLYMKPTEPYIRLSDPPSPTAGHKLVCQANSTSFPVVYQLPLVYRWTVRANAGHEYRSIVSGDFNETLVISEITRSDVISVLCQASEGGSTLSSQTEIEISPKYHVHPAVIVAPAVVVLILIAASIASVCVWRKKCQKRTKGTNQDPRGADLSLDTSVATLYEEVHEVGKLRRAKNKNFKIRRSHLELSLPSLPAVSPHMETTDDAGEVKQVAKVSGVELASLPDSDQLPSTSISSHTRTNGDPTVNKPQTVATTVFTASAMARNTDYLVTDGVFAVKAPYGNVQRELLSGIISEDQDDLVNDGTQRKDSSDIDPVVSHSWESDQSDDCHSGDTIATE